MKKLYILFLFLTAFANAQIVNIPDANFKSLLLQADVNNGTAQNALNQYMKIDTNSDGEIQVSEALAVAKLNLAGPNISDLTGLTAFSNLIYIDCGNYGLTNITLMGLPLLKTFFISQIGPTSIPITSINLNGVPSLETINCRYITSLATLNVEACVNLRSVSFEYVNAPNLIVDLTNSPAMQNFMASDCLMHTVNLSGLSQLTSPPVYDSFMNSTFDTVNLSGTAISGTLNLRGVLGLGRTIHHLDVSHCVNLVSVIISGVQLQSINLTGCTNLTGLDVSENNLTFLDLTTLINLQGLALQYNYHIEELDLSNCPNISGPVFGYSTGIKRLILKNGVNDLPFFFDSGYLMPIPLEYLCIDDSEYAAAMNYITANMNPENYPEVNTYCSFAPGGQYNTITGAVTFDTNNDGCGSGNAGIRNVRLDIDNGITNGACFTAGALDYTFYTQAGNYTITPSIENPSWFTFSPATVTIPFANNQNHIVTQNFCISPVGVHQDVEVVIIPYGGVIAGFDTLYQLTYKNKGNQAVSGNVTFVYDDAVVDYVSSTIAPSTQSNGLLTYNYTNLLPFESRTSYIRMNLNQPIETPPLNDGDILNYTATINSISDANPADNQFQLQQTVSNSFDPNDIVCVQGNRVSPSEIGNYLHYVVNFENTGSASAQNIVVKDIIDTTKFDVNSLQLIGSSGSVVSRLTGNVAEFFFEGINLQPQAHGNVSFKIKTKNTLVAGDTVNQSAGIYFDYNFPVMTDPANTIFQALSNPDVAVDSSIDIYPNPTKGLINIECNNNIKSVQLYDIQGRILQTNVVNENQASLDISTQSKGVYFIKIISDNGMKVQKIVKD